MLRCHSQRHYLAVRLIGVCGRPDVRLEWRAAASREERRGGRERETECELNVCWGGVHVMSNSASTLPSTTRTQVGLCTGLAQGLVVETT